MIFEHIPAEQLHPVWPEVKDGLLAVAEKGKERWIPEDVYVELREKRAFLVFGIEQGKRIGFFVWQRQIEPFTHDPLLNVWALYAAHEDGGALRFIDECVAEFERIAGVCKINRIRLGGRRGWEKALAGRFETLRTIYERVI